MLGTELPHVVQARPEGAEAPSPGYTLGISAIHPAPCFTLIEQALSVFFNVNYI